MSISKSLPNFVVVNFDNKFIRLAPKLILGAQKTAICFEASCISFNVFLLNAVLPDIKAILFFFATAKYSFVAFSSPNSIITSIFLQNSLWLEVTNSPIGLLPKTMPISFPMSLCFLCSHPAVSITSGLLVIAIAIDFPILPEMPTMPILIFAFFFIVSNSSL